MSNSLWQYFHKGEKQNGTHFKTFCKACVKHQMESLGAPLSDIVTQGQTFRDACEAVGHTLSHKKAWIAHLIGGKAACLNASAEAKVDAAAQRKQEESKKRARSHSPDGTEPAPKKQQQLQGTLTAMVFRRNDMPYGKDEKDAVQRQALRAIVSGGLPLGAFEDHEMLVLFGMLRSTAPAIMPTGKVVGGKLLDAAAADVELETTKALKDKKAGMSTDGWKGKNKDAVNAICANAGFKLYLIELVEVTALNKDGPALCEQFAGMIDRIELKHGCTIIYFTTDADGGSNKGRKLLGIKRPWLILPSCWAHQFQLILGDYFKVNDMAAMIAEDATALISWINNHGKVRKIFDACQRIISQDRNAGRIIVLAYLVANLTRWTTHFVAFCRLFLLRSALQLGVLQNRSAIIAAEVGAATSTEGERLKEDAEHFCALIEDTTFWNGLEAVLGDLEPICLGTNINQKDSTRLDQVLLTIEGIFLRFTDHPEPDVKKAMLIRLEKRWKDCDQPAFLVALILNPFEKLSCFGPNANLNQFKCLNLLIFLYRRMKDRPDNSDTPEERKVKEAEVSKVFMQYLSGTGDFADFDPETWEQTYDNTDPIQVWEALAGSRDLAELAEFAIVLLHIVANQAGCERTFSRTKIEQSDHRNRLGLEKIDKRTKIKAQIRSEHQKQSIYKPREGRKNHQSTAALLSVPRYRDLLDDQHDEDPSERGCALVSSREGWRTQLVKWVGNAKEAELAEQDSDAENDATDTITPRLPTRLTSWKPMTLQTLFGGAEKPRRRKPSARVVEEEERLMEDLADALEDEELDAGAIEINSDDEFRP
ncbi:ribonuclease H-like domain-containing protein [Mycena sp. CBHHK59/15]|nr:ribonuclease H-like domain-containing protein [Mycena sp. CBHHK59/15]